MSFIETLNSCVSFLPSLVVFWCRVKLFCFDARIQRAAMLELYSITLSCNLLHGDVVLNTADEI